MLTIDTRSRTGILAKPLKAVGDGLDGLEALIYGVVGLLGLGAVIYVGSMFVYRLAGPIAVTVVLATLAGSLGFVIRDIVRRRWSSASVGWTFAFGVCVLVAVVWDALG